MTRALLLLLAAVMLNLAQAYTADAQAGNRRLLQDNTFVPPGGAGSWQSGLNSGIIVIHSTLMKDGKVVGWTPMVTKGQTSVVIDPVKRTNAKTILGDCGLYGCKNAFCGAQTTTPTNEVLIFGGHSKDTQWFRRFNYNTMKVATKTMASNRWYLGVSTLADGRVAVIGGVKLAGYAGYGAKDVKNNNPAYEIYDPVSGKFGGDKLDMAEQLNKAFPLNTYPVTVVTPDGGLAVSSGSSLYKYKRTGPWTVGKEFAYKPRPHAPWSYPQTGNGVLLPLEPPYTRAWLMATGGSSKDKAKDGVPASAEAHKIELTAGAGANWQSVGPMPYPRVMGDGLILCDGTLVYLGGATAGVAGWGKTPRDFKFRDGKGFKCLTKCGNAFPFNFEPVIYDPATNRWSKKGSLSQAMRPRGYHSSALLMPDCSVMTAGSDVTQDKTAEFFKPPYLSKGPRPVILSGPASINAGATLTIPYTSADPVTKAILIRTGASTHSMQFDLRAAWLEIAVGPDTVVVQTPGSNNITPPGMYMLVLLSNKGVPSHGHLLSVNYPQ